MTVEVTRRGFLAGLLSTAVIVALPKTAVDLAPAAPEAIDPFSIVAPPGWRYQWVATSVMGEPIPEMVEQRIQNGWKFVLPKNHPGAPTAALGYAIESRGLVLMEKPEAEVRARLLAELKEREARLPQPHRVIVETPHGFAFQAKPKEPPDDELESSELQQPDEAGHREAG